MMERRYSQGTTASGGASQGLDRGYTPSDVQYSPTSPSVNDDSLASSPQMSPLPPGASAATELWPVVGLVVKLTAGETGVVRAPPQPLFSGGVVLIGLCEEGLGSQGVRVCGSARESSARATLLLRSLFRATSRLSLALAGSRSFRVLSIR